MAEKSDVTGNNFGVLIAFTLPGFLLLWGLTFSFPELAKLLAKSAEAEAPTVGGFLYVTLASLAVGLVVSAVRWLILDSLFHRVIGPKNPNIDFGKLRDQQAYTLFQGLNENHYRYYQYYSNTLISAVAALIAFAKVRGLHAMSLLMWLALLGVCLALFLGSRDCLSKFYARINQVADAAGTEDNE